MSDTEEIQDDHKKGISSQLQGKSKEQDFHSHSRARWWKYCGLGMFFLRCVTNSPDAEATKQSHEP